MSLIYFGFAIKNFNTHCDYYLNDRRPRSWYELCALLPAQVSPLLSQMGRMFGGSDALNPELLSGKLEEMLPVIRQVTNVPGIWTWTLSRSDCKKFAKVLTFSVSTEMIQSGLFPSNRWTNNSRTRTRRPSCACASPSSSRFTRLSGWSRSWPSAASTRTTSSLIRDGAASHGSFSLGHLILNWFDGKWDLSCRPPEKARNSLRELSDTPGGWCLRV